MTAKALLIVLLGLLMVGAIWIWRARKAQLKAEREARRERRIAHKREWAMSRMGQEPELPGAPARAGEAAQEV